MKSGHIGKFGHIGEEHVRAAMQEFDKKRLKAMLKKYGGEKSTKWYIHLNGRFYDQKLIIRAAHALKFTAEESKRHLENNLGFEVVEGCCKTTR